MRFEERKSKRKSGHNKGVLFKIWIGTNIRISKIPRLGPDGVMWTDDDEGGGRGGGGEAGGRTGVDRGGGQTQFSNFRTSL